MNNTDSKQDETCPFCAATLSPYPTDRLPADLHAQAGEWSNIRHDEDCFIALLGFGRYPIHQDRLKAWNTRSRASVAAPGVDAQSFAESVAKRIYWEIDGVPDTPEMIEIVKQEWAKLAAASSPASSSDTKFVPPAEDALHVAICQAVQEHHGPSANAILRSALNDYKPTQLTRTELIRVQ